MSKTVLFGGLFHETHTFLSQTTTVADFEAVALHRGQDAITANLGNASPSDGFLSYALEQGWTILPTIQMAAMPGGKAADAAVTLFRDAFFAGLAQHMDQLDGIYLVLHGAMVSQSSDDVEGELLADIRAALRKAGRDIPVVAVLDLHANVSHAMVDNSTALRAYRENPHSDARDAAVAAAVLLGQSMDGLAMAQVHLPTRHVLPPTGVGSASNPMKAVLAAARAIEARDPAILNINVMAGYAYSDIADCGFSLSCVTTGDIAKASTYLSDLAALLETHLAEGYPLEDDLATALRRADALPDGRGPILLIEAADNIGGGTPGDATGVLGPLLAAGRMGVMAAIADEDAVKSCVAAGIGGTIDIAIGAKTDRHHGEPVQFRGIVRNLTDGHFELENPKSHLASMVGTHADMGPCAVIENEQAIILLSTRKMPPMDIGQLHSQGMKPAEASYIVVKAAVSHRDAYDPIARASFYVDSPGLCTSNLKRLPYSKLNNKSIALD
ncbi:hypothetical protein WH87_12085 [Devosia epidermidihirudinis]|uniref:Microcystinase C n=1 Tax=Devosia epidermidihirudinis TaxID=1293439 RepID=A0A0F5QBB8_9HYPH|nr:M81 family metallopeptidase [Devosia epidermidihirudinis]KKC37289.1 hypothetical protein WH87_12085 [Devosia epidermidihirudinis]